MPEPQKNILYHPTPLGCLGKGGGGGGVGGRVVVFTGDRLLTSPWTGWTWRWFGEGDPLARCFVVGKKIRSVQ